MNDVIIVHPEKINIKIKNNQTDEFENKTFDIEKYSFSNGKYTIWYKKSTKSYTYAEVRVRIEKINVILLYLKDIVKVINNEKPGGCPYFLQYENGIDVQSESVLKYYLEPALYNAQSNTYSNNTVIFPFSFNLSQKTAIEKALSQKISIIEGPPGTGKTQTILNIIANLILRQKTIAVVSNNNSATLNVQEKLKKNELAFISAFLGSNDNQKYFFENSSDQYSEEIKNWERDIEKINRLQLGIEEDTKYLSYLLDLKNKKAALMQEKKEIALEQVYFLCNNEQLHQKISGAGTSKKIQNIFIQIDACEKISNADFFLKKLYIALKIFFAYRYNLFPLTAENMYILIKRLYEKYYIVKLESIQSNINAIDKKLEKANFEKTLDMCAENSMEFFKAKLFERFIQNSKAGNKLNRTKFEIETFKKNFSEFTYEYPVILSTTQSLKRCSEHNYLFDYVIIDESSQVDIATGVLALSCAKNSVLVGDVKQLTHIVETEIHEKAENVRSKYGILDSYDYNTNSLLQSFIAVFKDSDIPRTMLREHYRCHPQIINFCNKKFYNDELIIHTYDTHNAHPLMIYETQGNVPATQISTGTYNQREIDVIRKEVLPNIKDDDIGFISPYRLQAEKLEKEYEGNKNIEAATVHKYQGREKNVIILTTVKKKENNFIDAPELINVAVSRAKNKLILVTSPSMGERLDSNIGDLIRYIKYNSPEKNSIKSTVYSIFDKMHSDYVAYISCYNDSPAELLVNELLVATLKDFPTLRYERNYRLQMLIKDTSLLAPEERNFMYRSSHVDFILFNKLDMNPVLAIEVDGVTYHEKNKKQSSRDKIKNEILRKVNIPLLRFPTTGSEEEEKLRSILNKKIPEEIIKNLTRIGYS